jgi:hypothetical protein
VRFDGALPAIGGVYVVVDRLPYNEADDELGDLVTPMSLPSSWAPGMERALSVSALDFPPIGGQNEWVVGGLSRVVLCAQ